MKREVQDQVCRCPVCGIQNDYSEPDGVSLTHACRSCGEPFTDPAIVAALDGKSSRRLRRIIFWSCSALGIVLLIGLLLPPVS